MPVVSIENLGVRAEADINRTVVLELVRATEAAARSAVVKLGQQDKNALDGMAVDAMRRALNTTDIQARVALGEGEKDEAPMLYSGEEVGTGQGPLLELAIDPVDGTTLASKGRDGAISVLAAAQPGSFLNAPDVHYMDKLAVGPGVDIRQLNLDMPADDIVRNIARQKDVRPQDVVVCMLDRERNAQLMAGVRKAGARMKLITDGDIAGAISTALPDAGVDVLMGAGGVPEGVIAAAALKCLGGDIIGRLKFTHPDMLEKTKARGLKNAEDVFTMEHMAAGETLFVATGVTDGNMLRGIRRKGAYELSHSMVMRSRTQTLRYIEAWHKL